MTAFKLVGVALLSCITALVLRGYKPELVIPFILAAGAAMLVCALSMMTEVTNTFRDAFARLGVDAYYIRVALKIIGLAYLVQFASGVCKDAGESALSGKVELLGRIMILSASAPVILRILDVLESFVALS